MEIYFQIFQKDGVGVDFLEGSWYNYLICEFLVDKLEDIEAK